MRADVFLVFTGFRIKRGPEEQHVFKKVREPGEILRVAVGTGVDVHSGGGFFGSRIGDQQHLHAVAECERPIFAGVVRALYDNRTFCGEIRCAGTGAEQDGNAGKSNQETRAEQGRDHGIQPE